MLSATDDTTKSWGSIRHDLRDCFEQRWEWIRIRTSVLLAAEGIILKVSLGARCFPKISVCCGITLYVLNLNYFNVTIINSPLSWISMFGDIDFSWSDISKIFHILTNKMCKLKYNKIDHKTHDKKCTVWVTEIFQYNFFRLFVFVSEKSGRGHATRQSAPPTPLPYYWAHHSQLRFCWASALQAGRSWVRFPMTPLEFFINIILPAALWS